MVNWVLWGALALALLSSVSHLAFTFGMLERVSWLGWIPAIAVDAGLLALAYSIQQRRRAKRNAITLWAGVILFAIISMIANLYHALSVEGTGTITIATLASVDWLQLGLAIVLSATLPVMVVYLGEIVSSDDAAEALRAERAIEREARKAERDASEAVHVEAAKVIAEKYPCMSCGRLFDSQQALAGHAKAHKVAKEVGR